MQVSDFSFELPASLIAQYPRTDHENDRLLVIDRNTGEYQDRMFKDFPSLLKKGDVLVLNDTKVRKSRLYATNENGGNVEVLFLHPTSSDLSIWNVITNHSKRRKIGEKLVFEDGTVSHIKDFLDDGIKVLEFENTISEKFFENIGHVPLPPYIKREDELSDEKTYQTIYSKNIGSSASPTSGLHFTKEILNEIEAKGVEILYITLHVGMGTFMPMRTDILEEHKMHSEYFEVSEAVANRINKAKSENRTIVASGTTVMRTLESVWSEEKHSVVAQKGTTDIFIYPGFKFHVCDELLTNFHTPESTLFALVSAFSSIAIAKKAYKHAVDEKYRFFSYGDATFFKI